MKKLLQNGIVVNGGESYLGWVLIDGAMIDSVGEMPAPAPADDVEVVDCTGCYILPGVIDMHVHFRQPGMDHKGTWATESRAAVAGGVTSVVEMPNVKPPTTTIAALEQKEAIAQSDSLVNYGFWMGADGHNIKELQRAVKRPEVAGVKVFMGSSTGSLLCDDVQALCNILTDVHAPVAVHAEDEMTITANRMKAIDQYGTPARVPLSEHHQIRSSLACQRAVRTAVDAQGWYGGQLHVLHVSSAAELREMEGTDAVGEACVGHLWFTYKDMEQQGARIKVNPAIKSENDRHALRRAVREGDIQIISTDHAPHLLDDKKGGALTAASGMPAIQYSLPMMLELADMGVFSLERVVECMCHNPAAYLHIDRRGALMPGFYADVAIVRADDPYTVQDADALSLCGWTPLAGHTFRNRVVATYVNGQQAFPIADQPQSSAMALNFAKE